MPADNEREYEGHPKKAADTKKVKNKLLFIDDLFTF